MAIVVSWAAVVSPASDILRMHVKYPRTTAACCLFMLTPSVVRTVGVISSIDSNGSGLPQLLDNAAIRAASVLSDCCLNLRTETCSGWRRYLSTTVFKFANRKLSAIRNHRS